MSVDRRSQRRTWMILGAVLALVATYLVVWGTYAAVHVYPRYAQLAPGQASRGDASYRLLNLTGTEVVKASQGDDVTAPAGTRYVIATLEVTIDKPMDIVNCDLELLGPGGRTWDSTSDAPTRALPSYCSDDDDPVRPGRPYRFENIFEIPAVYADQLRGIAVDDPASSKPQQVIIPG